MIREEIESEFEGVVFADAKYDNAIIGIVEGIGIEPSPLYDKSKIYKKEIPSFNHFMIDGRKTSDEVCEIELEPGEEHYLFPTGYNEDLIGIVEKNGEASTTLYDREKVIERMMADFGDSEDAYMDAIENYHYNFIGGYVGEKTWKCAVLFKEYE